MGNGSLSRARELFFMSIVVDVRRRSSAENHLHTMQSVTRRLEPRRWCTLGTYKWSTLSYSINWIKLKPSLAYCLRSRSLLCCKFHSRLAGRAFTILMMLTSSPLFAWLGNYLEIPPSFSKQGNYIINQPRNSLLIHYCGCFPSNKQTDREKCNTKWQSNQQSSFLNRIQKTAYWYDLLHRRYDLFFLQAS